MRISDWSSDVCSSDLAEQTKDILARIDELLAEAGSDKTKLLSATIWLTDIATFDQMNGLWDAWVAPGAAPARACVEAKLAAPQYAVEIAVVAARCATTPAGASGTAAQRVRMPGPDAATPTGARDDLQQENSLAAGRE